ncbi:hypothetical protein [Clostridium sp. DL1XJH146]
MDETTENTADETIDTTETTTDETIDETVDETIEEEPTPTGDYTFDINKMIADQLGVFQNDFITQINAEYKEKFEKLKKDIDDIEKKKKKLAIIEELKTEGLDSSLIEFVYDDNIEIAKLKIAQIKKIIMIGIEQGIELKLKTSSYIPGGSSDNLNDNIDKNKPKYFV